MEDRNVAVDPWHLAVSPRWTVLAAGIAAFTAVAVWAMTIADVRTAKHMAAHTRRHSERARTT